MSMQYPQHDYSRGPSYSLTHSQSQSDYDYVSYNDFNNAGIPKSSSQQLLAQDIVPLPTLGEEWGATEGKRERYAKRKARTERVGGWFSQTGAGISQSFGELRRSVCVLGSAFAFIIALGITLYFVIPRSPSIEFVSFTSTDSNPTRDSVDGSFNFDGNLTFQFDARGSWIAVHMSQITTTVKDLNTEEDIATGLASHTIPGRQITTLTLPVTFSGSFGNASSTTYADVADACAPIYTNVDRPDLGLVMTVEMKITGIIGKHFTTTQAQVTCPIEFPSNSS